MAYAALVSLEQTIHQILNQARYSTSTQEKHHLASLDKYVISFQAFLEGFPDKSKIFEARIRDAATAAEDILECFMLDQILLDHRRLINEPPAVSKLKYNLNKVAKKMETIATKVMMIKDEKLGGTSIFSSSSAAVSSGKIDVVGFDDDLLEIKDRLAGRSPELQYLAISGMGGIGKTTLARNAYDDPLIQEHFDIRAWVTISQDYRAQEILSCLLDSMKELNPKGSRGMSVAEMADRIYKILYGRRYLIVMDDVWSTEVLDDVRKLFPDDGNRSRIMLTTRLFDVAAYAHDSSPHQMRLMDEQKSWDLLKQKISRDNLSDELEMVGHEIARSCKGLPLAVVVVAGILSSISESPASWAEVAKNVNKATSKDDRMEEVVSLGYNHLPHRLRPCLLYMGLLPEDYSIRNSLLIKLWIAEGFLKYPDDDSSKSLEADAEEYLEDLVRRNLILVTGRKYNGKIKSCSLHDMVRETCIRLLKEEKHLRHVTPKEDNEDCISKRSVLRFSYDDDGMSQPFFLKRFRLLRVLHVPRNEYNLLKELKLYHLRHLCFFYDELYFFNYERYLPADLSYFENLQSFIITHGIDIQLPPSIWKLRLLRHIIVNLGFLPDPDATSALEKLQTLKRVVFDEKIIKSLERVPNLIKLGLYLDSEYSELHLNESLVCLRQLRISSRRGYQYPNHLSAVFPESLKKLTQNFG